MNRAAVAAAACLVLAPVFAEGLPDLGDVSQTVLSPIAERKLGEEIMREIRADPSYVDEPELTDYLNAIGSRLAQASPDSKRAFEFFAIQDNSVNAFALPGGFIGVHTGTLLISQTESELASVLSHEIGHVVQHHMSRMIANQEKTQMVSLAALAAAILVARSNSQASQAIAAGSQAVAVQSQLNFTRDNEREADRVGVQILERSKFDVHAMPVFFERLQRSTRFIEGSAPSYLRTHPLPFERIADIQNRTQNLPYRQVPDGLVFQMLRARLRAEQDSARDAITYFEDMLAQRKFTFEAAARYGLATARLRDKDYTGARRELEALRRLVPESPMVDTFAARLLNAAGDGAGALAAYRAGLARHPEYRALVYGYIDTLLATKNPAEALAVVEQQQQLRPQDAQLYLLQARGYAAQGKQLLQHRAQAEAYARQGDVRAAIEQLQIALRAGDGDFYQLSIAEARLRELRAQDPESAKRERR